MNITLKPVIDQIPLSNADKFVGSWISVNHTSIKRFYVYNQEVPSESIKSMKSGDTVNLIMKRWRHDIKGVTISLCDTSCLRNVSNPYDGDYSETSIVLKRCGGNLVWVNGGV